MYIFSKEKQLNTEHGVYLIDISIFLVLIHQTWKSFSRGNINPLAKRKRDLILNIRRKIFRDVYGFLRHRKPRLLMYFEGALWLERTCKCYALNGFAMLNFHSIKDFNHFQNFITYINDSMETSSNGRRKKKHFRFRFERMKSIDAKT